MSKKILKILIGAIGGFILLLLLLNVWSMVKRQSLNKTPVKSIEASCDIVYSQGQEINKKDFRVTAIHEDGAKEELEAAGFDIDKKYPEKTGRYTKVKISLKEKPSISDTIKVKNERTEIVSFACGKPVKKDVQAVLYSNGELAFEGHGDVRQFENYPWLEYAASNTDQPIRAVTFEDTVIPKSMDEWFTGMESLEYVKNIPKTVTSMEATFSGCAALAELPDMSECTELLNINQLCFECESLKEVPELPASVTSASGAFESCLELTKVTNMDHLTNLINASRMFADCEGLVEMNIPPNVTDLTEYAAKCINLSKMPMIPETAEIMAGTFNSCTSMTELSGIPANVKDISGCFQNCDKISGVLEIQATPSEYNSCLSGTCISTKIDLQGASKILDLVALTCETRNVTVQGKLPNENARYDAIYIE